MQQEHTRSQQRNFTASEVAEFEYCPLVWWYEQYDPLAQAETEELFARMVELEDEHGAQAPALPEYQVIEQLLVRKGAFEEGRQQHSEHAAEVEQAEAGAERVAVTGVMKYGRRLVLVAAVLVFVAILLILAAIFLH